MQRRRRRQQVQKQNQQDGQDAQRHPAMLEQTGFYQMQIVCNIATLLPNTSG
jgi:hypothetical protein